MRTTTASHRRLNPFKLAHLEAPHLLDYAGILHKRRWAAVGAFLVVVVGMTVQAYTSRPVYQVRAKILIEAESPNVLSFREVVDESRTRSDYYQTQYDILRSRSLARKTLDRLQLWHHPAFGGAAAGSSLAAGIAGVDGDAPDLRNPAPAVPLEAAAEARAINRLLAGLTVAPVRNSRIVDLKFRSEDDALAARIVNAHAQGYIAQTLEFRLQASKEAWEWLSARLDEQRAVVAKAETALYRYLEDHDARSLVDRANIIEQRVVDLSTALTRARTERVEKEGRLRQVQALQAQADEVEAFPAVLSNEFIQQLKADLSTHRVQHTKLKETLGDRHPEMVAIRARVEAATVRLDTEINKVVASVNNEFVLAQTNEGSLLAALQEQEREALALSRKRIDYDVLRRDVQTGQQIYDGLLQRLKETGISGELRTSNIRVVDAAEVPGTLVAPRTRLHLPWAPIGGIFLAITLCFFLEYLDNRVRTPEDLKTHLGLAFLGLVPKIDIRATSPVGAQAVPPEFAEAIRLVRTNLLFSRSTPGPRSVLITSTQPAEGKTMIASHLATALAQVGQRVLLVDADMRRPCLHRRFDVPAEPGLSNLIVGNAAEADVLRPTTLPNLWLVTAGRVPPDPAELLGSDRFTELLRRLEARFDWVLIDSPPVMAVADPSIVGHATAGVMFVVGAEMVARPAARAAIDQLESAQVKVLGAVLNRVDLARNAYYYSRYYRKEHAGYYTPAANTSGEVRS